MKLRTLVFAATAFCGLLASTVSAQISLDYRGTLTDASSNPITTATTIRFVICRGGTATGDAGSVCWRRRLMTYRRTLRVSRSVRQGSLRSAA